MAHVRRLLSSTTISCHLQVGHYVKPQFFSKTGHSRIFPNSKFFFWNQKNFDQIINYMADHKKIFPTVTEGSEFPNCFFSSTLHHHAVNPLPKERQGLEAAVNRILSHKMMICSNCHLPAAKHKKVLVCDPCHFISCGKCAKKHKAAPVICIKPGSDPKLPFANRLDQKKEGKKWIGFRQDHTGEIIFSKVCVIFQNQFAQLEI